MSTISASARVEAASGVEPPEHLIAVVTRSALGFEERFEFHARHPVEVGARIDRC